METFLEFLREILKGMLRETSGILFRKNILENEKTTPLRHKKKGDSQDKQSIKLTTTTLTVEVVGRSANTLLSLSISIIHKNMPII